MTKCKKKVLQGFSLVELLVAIGVFGVMSSFLVFLTVDAVRAFENLSKRNQATEIIKETYSALKLIKSEEWFNVTKQTNLGPKHIGYIDGKYTIIDGEGEKGSLTYSFSVVNAMRDSSGNIVTEGGNLDPHSKKIDINIKWYDRINKEHAISSSLYVNDWNVNNIVFTTKADFQKGTHLFTAGTDDKTGGELRLQSILYPDWCQPQRLVTKHDIPGDAYARSVLAKDGYVYTGTRAEVEGEPFTKLQITGVENPVLTVLGTFSGYSIKDIYVDGNYAYLATTDDTKEIVIIDISTTPYTEVGYVDGPDTWDANSVYVKGNIGYFAQSTYVRTFDLSSKTGKRPVLASANVSLIPWIANVSQISVRSTVENGVNKTYIFASLNWDWYEFGIVDATNPSSLKLISRTTVNDQQVLDMYVSEDSNLVFFGTNSSSQKEFYVIDTRSKSGKRPILASVDTNGMSVRGITVVETGKVAILVGTGAEEYQVFYLNIVENPFSVTVTKCGGMHVDSGIYDVDSIIDSKKNTFSYIVTGDASREFQIIRGGPGGSGDEEGNGYLEKGVYISPLTDSGSTTSEYYTIGIDTDIPTGTTLQIKFRFSNSPTTILDPNSTEWRGIDSTTTYLSTTGIYSLPIGTKGRYFQYKADLISDPLKKLTPLLKEIVFSYEK